MLRYRSLFLTIALALTLFLFTGCGVLSDAMGHVKNELGISEEPSSLPAYEMESSAETGLDFSVVYDEESPEDSEEPSGITHDENSVTTGEREKPLMLTWEKVEPKLSDLSSVLTAKKNRIIADSWASTEKVEEFVPVRVYLLESTAPAGLNQGENKPMIFIIYRISASNPAGSISYYWYGSFSDITDSKEGLTVNTAACHISDDDASTPEIHVGSYYYCGYETIDQLYIAILSAYENTYNISVIDLR